MEHGMVEHVAVWINLYNSVKLSLIAETITKLVAASGSSIQQWQHNAIANQHGMVEHVAFWVTNLNFYLRKGISRV